MNEQNDIITSQYTPEISIELAEIIEATVVEVEEQVPFVTKDSFYQFGLLVEAKTEGLWAILTPEEIQHPAVVDAVEFLQGMYVQVCLNLRV